MIEMLLYYVVVLDIWEITIIMDKKKDTFIKDLKRIDYMHQTFKKLFLKICLTNKNVDFHNKDIPEGASLILSNHVSPFDYLYILKAFEDKTISFVASEDAFKNKLVRFIAVKLVGIIVHMRGKNEIKTTREMIKRLNAGMNVMIFPEGSSTFDGRTAPVGIAIAKIAKMSGANLVLVRNEGGYLVKPRWSTRKRLGLVDIKVLSYTKDDMKNMSAQQILEEINNNLYFDAYEAQKNNPKTFVGKNLAYGLEATVYQCPKCKAISKSLHTKGDSIYCDCGFNALYNEHGFLVYEDNEHAVSELTDCQKAYLRDSIAASKVSGEQKLLFEEDLTTYRLYVNGKRGKATKIHLKTFTDHVEYSAGQKSGRYDFNQIRSLFVFIRNKLIVFSEGLEYGYELYGDFSTSALKYKDLYEIVNK